MELLMAIASSHLLMKRGRSKISRTICRIPVRPFVYIVKAGQLACLKTRKWRQTPRPAPRNIRCPAQSKLLYKSSGLIRRPLNVQGEHHAFHDDYVSERIRNRKTRLGARLQKHGENGQVQRGTREGRGAARARRANSARDDERARYLQRRKVESYRRPFPRNEGSGRRL